LLSGASTREDFAPESLHRKQVIVFAPRQSKEENAGAPSSNEAGTRDAPHARVTSWQVTQRPNFEPRLRKAMRETTSSTSTTERALKTKKARPSRRPRANIDSIQTSKVGAGINEAQPQERGRSPHQEQSSIFKQPPGKLIARESPLSKTEKQ